MLAVTPLRNPAAGDLPGDVGGATNIQSSDDFSVEFEFDFDFSEIFAGFDDAESLPSPQISIDAEQKEGEEETVTNDKCEQVLVKEEILVEKEKESGRKVSAHGEKKRSNGKRKVDWSAELHRRFVEVVEQLGEEHAVPSRILELMGIDCLTRHNVASHLQKYRSHRKHRMARDAETRSSKQRRQVYAACLPLTMGFTPNSPHHLRHHAHTQHFRPLHVWGHPTMNQSLIHMWPKQLIPVGPTSSLPWVAPPHPIQPIQMPPRGSPWSPHFAMSTMAQGAPYFSRPPPTLRFPALTVPGIPPHPMSSPNGMILAAPPPTPPPCKQADWLHQLDAHPSKESIDAALGDVLGQPWLPLPLGLKPPSLESVMVELQKQGISNVPPSS